MQESELSEGCQPCAMAATSPPPPAEPPRKRRKSTRWGADEGPEEPAVAAEPGAAEPAAPAPAANQDSPQIRARPKRSRWHIEPPPEAAAERPPPEPEAPPALPTSLAGLIGTDAMGLSLHRRLGEVRCSRPLPAAP